VKLPPVHRTTLPNGLSVLIVEHHELPTVAMNLSIRSGSGTNPLDHAGLAGMVADMLLLGTSTRSADEIAEQVDAIGALLVAEAGWDSSSLSASGLSADLGTLLELLADLASKPTFPDAELDLLKQRLVNELKTKLDNPSWVANDAYSALLFPSHPYGLPPDGTIHSVRTTSRDDLVRFHAAHYSPANALLVIVGDVSPEETRQAVAKSFGRWKKGAKRSSPVARASPPKGLRIALVDRPDLTQSQIRIGHLGVARSTPDWFPLQVANYILGGGGFSSRLLDRIRVQKGYTYGLRSVFSARFSTGPFTISTFTPHATVPEVIQETLDVIREFQQKGPEEKELADAKNFYVSGYPQSFETPARIASALIEVELYGLGEGYIESYQDRIAAVTAKDVRRVAKTYFDTKNLIILAVTKADAVRERLAPLASSGTVELVPLP
jgi:zinc protease